MRKSNLKDSPSIFRIGIVALLTNEGRSGVGQYLINLIQTLVQVDPKKHYVIIKFQGDSSLTLAPGSNISVHEVSACWKKPALSIFWHILYLPILARKLNFELVHLPSYRRPTFLLPCPSIVTVHDMAIFRIPKKYGILRYAFHRLITRAFLRRAVHIVTDSMASKRDILHFMKIRAVPISVVYLGINPAEFYQRNKIDAQKFMWEKSGIHSPFILCVSRLEHPGKNLVQLIEAFSLLKEREAIPHKLVIAGSPWNGSSLIFRAAQVSKYSKEIIFPGFVDQGILPFLYNAADMFVFPTLWEGFGFPVLEAMACGVPVACSNVASLPEIVGNAAHMFDPFDREAIVDAMKLCLNPSENQILRGLEQANRFSWKATSQIMIQFYEKYCYGT